MTHCLEDRAEKQPEMTTFSTGAIRGTDMSECLLHMIPPTALRAWGRAFGEGAAKYGKYNWLKGFPISSLLDHALGHIFKFIEGDESEDHLGHALWNIGAAIHFKETKPELVDLPPYKGTEPCNSKQP